MAPDPTPDPDPTHDPDELAERRPRVLSRVVEPIHAVTYYSREMTEPAALSALGYRGWWHGYFAYRPAPMGAVGAATVTAAFYNFAPRMVARAVPGVWDIRSPADTVALRQERVEQALARIFGPGPDLAPTVALLRRALDGVDGAGRPLFSAYAGLPWPALDLPAVWHACTLLRELRGDSHNIALAAAEVDGVGAHVLMAGRGHGNRPTIQAIRGWNDDEWDGAVARLQARGWLGADGSLTGPGRQAREAIERHTDALAAAPVRDLGVDFAALIEGLTPLAHHLTATGEVSGTWPPPHLRRPD